MTKQFYQSDRKISNNLKKEHKSNMSISIWQQPARLTGVILSWHLFAVGFFCDVGSCKSKKKPDAYNDFIIMCVMVFLL